MLTIARAAALSLLPAVAIAQSPTPPTRTERDGTLVFEDRSDAFRIESVGLSFYLPDGVLAEATRMGDQAVVRLEPGDKLWFGTVTTPRTSNPQTTAEQVADEAIKQILGAAGVVSRGGEVVGLKGQILSRDAALIINERNAARFYVEVPREGKEPAVRGQTIFKTSADQFVIFEYFTDRSTHDRARQVYETMVASATFAAAGDVSEARAAAVRAGMAALARVSEEDLREIAASRGERWERLFKPGPTGAESDDTEIAYRRVRVWIGPRSDLREGKPGVDKGDSAQGLLVRIDARSLDGPRVLDSQGVYFVSLDRADEAWTLRNAVREGKETAVYTETGARSGKSITVNTEATGSPGKVIKPTIQGDGYVSRGESFLLPQLLVRAAVPTDLAFYTYQSDSGTIRIRRDELSQQPDRPGVWVLSTRLREDAPPMVSRFTTDGELIRTELPDGSVWEPVKLDRLIRLWRDKNLPMD